MFYSKQDDLSYIKFINHLIKDFNAMLSLDMPSIPSGKESLKEAIKLFSMIEGEVLKSMIEKEVVIDEKRTLN